MRMLNEAGTVISERLVDLVYELLDAHRDTIALADDLEGSLVWDAHLDYLRGLQRVGRETLARVGEPVG
jgi:hypothetical protein